MVIVIVMSVISGVVGTLIGSALALIFGKGNDKLFAGATACSAGIMLSLVFFDLMPEAMENGSNLTVLLGFGIGLAFMFCVSLVVDKTEEAGGERNPYTIALAIALHNLPAGLLIGIGDSKETIAIAIALMLHNLPEGFALTLPIFRKTSSVVKSLLVAILVGIPTVIGALLSNYVMGLSTQIAAAGLAFAAGSMFSVVHTEMYPTLFENKNKLNAALVCAGLLVGCICMTLIGG